MTTVNIVRYLGTGAVSFPPTLRDAVAEAYPSVPLEPVLLWEVFQLVQDLLPPQRGIEPVLKKFVHDWVHDPTLAFASLVIDPAKKELRFDEEPSGSVGGVPGEAS